MLVLVQVLDELVKAGRRRPSLVAISVTGVGSSIKHLPYMYKVSHCYISALLDADPQLLLPWLLNQTIDDKRGVETILTHVAKHLPSESDLPSPAVLDPAILETITNGFLSEVLVVRAAQLKDTDGSIPLRTGEDV